jgi:hypothetical protein
VRRYLRQAMYFGLGVIFVAALALLCVMSGCASAPPVASLPHRPLSEIDIQGHPPAWVMAVVDDCPGHVAEVLLESNGNVLLLCRSALLVVIP